MLWGFLRDFVVELAIPSTRGMPRRKVGRKVRTAKRKGGWGNPVLPEVTREAR